jgi:hypothetical protein
MSREEVTEIDLSMLWFSSQPRPAVAELVDQLAAPGSPAHSINRCGENQRIRR